MIKIFNNYKSAFASFASAAAAMLLRSLSTRRDLDGLLLFAAKTDRPILADVCLRAGADVHVAHDGALKSASYGGFPRTARVLLRRFDPAQDAAMLEQIERDASRFKHSGIVQLIKAKLGH